MDFDNVLPHIGHQRYQQLVFICLAIPCSIMSVVAMYNVLFLSATPDHWCRVPELEDTNLTVEEKINLSIPWELRDGLYKPSMCKMYDINYTELVDNLGNRTAIYKQLENLPQTDCKYGWIYDRSLYTSTLVTEMDIVCSKSWMSSLSMSVFYAGSLPGNIFFGYIGDRFGRKPTLISIILMDVIVGFASSFSPTYVFYIVCRFILGLGFPSLYRLAFIIAMELMIPKRRATCGMLYSILFSLGMVALAGLAYLVRNWLYLSVATSLPFAVLIAYWWFLTESPRWYLSHNRLEKADMIIRKIAKFNGKTIPEGYLQNIGKFTPATQEEPATQKLSVLDLIRTPNLRKKFLVINFVWIVIAFDYSGLSLGSTSLGVNDYIAFAISGLVEIPGICIAWFGVEKIGRRLMLCIAMLVGGISLISTGIMPVDYIWETFALSNVGKLGISAAFAVIYIYASELVPTVLRSVALATCSFTSGVVLILAPQLLALANVYGRIFPLMVFGILSLCGGLLILLLPETLNTNLPQTVQESEEFGSKTKCLSCFSTKKTVEIEQEASVDDTAI